MPCYDSRDDIRYVEKPFDHHNNPTAELLCGLLKNMSPDDLGIYVPKGSKIWHWWEDHKERDARKKRDEWAAKRAKEQNRLVRIQTLEKELTKLKKG